MSKQKKQKQQSFLSATWFKRIEFVGLIALLGLLYYHAKHFNFVQDDSFITFRYVKNFAEGHGLVFNIGERVEGYTTFLWTILLAVPAILNFDMISTSQIIGVLFGLATLYLMYRLSLEISTENRPIGFSLIAILFLACNSAVAYWSISGMETGMFMFLTVLSVWLYIKERKQEKKFAYAPFAFVLLSLTRPEGMYLFGLTMMHFIAEVFLDKERNRKEEFKRLVMWGALYAIPIGLFMGWRLFYYGWLFPNTYYAKAGFSKEYFNAGVDYFWQFAQMDLFWGALLVLPIALLLWKRRSSEILYLSFLILTYTAYIVSVGGDVLPNFRFFISILPLMYLLVQESLFELYKLFEEKRSMLRYIVYASPLVLAYYTYSIPYDHVRRYCDLENGLVEKMTEQGKWFKANSKPGAVIAASTIGAVSFYSEMTLIDMLGLTDETIAHNPEPLEDLQSGWKERHHNSTYVLSRKPDWILFSTGFKPSAFAERALFTKKEFRQWYHQYYFHPGGDAEGIGIVYKRAEQPWIDSSLTDSHPIRNQFVNDYYDGVNRISRWPNDAMEYFKKSEAAAPADFGMLYEAIAQTYLTLKNTQEAIRYYEKAIAADPRLIESNRILGTYMLQIGNAPKALQYLEMLVKVDPDFSNAWTLYGQALVSVGDVSRAQAAFQKALEVAPNNAEAYSLLQRLSSRG
ncbi:MAG: tetratricopeptide repeat protein [Ignavibacteriae bacterium]|nr:tetratricopeptide repeat protein [Ignavibacteriota bacterium]